MNNYRPEELEETAAILLGHAGQLCIPEKTSVKFSEIDFSEEWD